MWRLQHWRALFLFLLNWRIRKLKLKNLKVSLLSLLLVLAFALAACGNNATTGNENTPANNTATNETATNDTNEQDQEVSNQTQYPYTVTDSSSIEVTLEAQPERVVSLVPSETEVLFAVGKGDVVVGVDENSNYPEETAAIEKVGDFNINIEAVAALNPDLVLANPLNGEAITKLRELGLTVYVSNPTTYDEVVEHITQVGVLLNEQAGAATVAEEMVTVKNSITEKLAGVEPRKVYLEFSAGWTVGSGEFLDNLVTMAGGINVAGSQSGWFEVDAEAVITENPAVIIYPDFGEAESSILAGITARPGWEAIDAVKNNEMVMVSNDPLVRVGPRLSQGLSEIAAAIHPELFQ